MNSIKNFYVKHMYSIKIKMQVVFYCFLASLKDSDQKAIKPR